MADVCFLPLDRLSRFRHSADEVMHETRRCRIPRSFGLDRLVALTVNKGTPSILARQHAELVRTFTYEYRQPYHTAAKMPAEEAGEFAHASRSEASRLPHDS